MSRDRDVAAKLAQILGAGLSRPSADSISDDIIDLLNANVAKGVNMHVLIHALSTAMSSMAINIVMHQGHTRMTGVLDDDLRLMLDDVGSSIGNMSRSYIRGNRSEVLERTYKNMEKVIERQCDCDDCAARREHAEKVMPVLRGQMPLS